MEVGKGIISKAKKSDVVRGVSWMGFLRVATRGLAFARIAILARILNPTEFGLFGIAILVLAFVELFTETGINVFFIQGEGKIREYVNTAWIFSLIRGVFISSLIFFAAPLVSSFFNSPDSLGLLRLVSLVPLLRGFINPSIVKFQKELLFNKEFALRMSISVVDSLVAIFVSLILRSAYGLVWGFLAGVVVEILISHLFISPKPKLAFEINKAKAVVGRGKWITGAGVFNYLFQQGDDILVGKLLGGYWLGIYQLAYKISTLPITEIADVFNKVTFPVYSKISGNTPRLRRLFLKTTLGAALLVVPLSLILFFFPKQVILILLGDKWLEAVPLLKVLSIFGIVRAISGSVTPVFLAVKKQEYLFVFTLLSVLGMAVVIFPMIKAFGVVGAGIAALVGSLSGVPIVFYYLSRVLSSK